MPVRRYALPAPFQVPRRIEEQPKPFNNAVRQALLAVEVVTYMLVSIHIPKTGGTTLRESILKPALGDRLKMDYGDKPLATEVSVRNESALAFEPPPDLASRYDCVHGHFLATKYLSENFPCQFAVWFRDPVQRMVSRYFDGKRTQGSLVTPDMSLAEFCEIEKFHNTYH
ncbi:MAG: hypothetical protein F4229_18890 [Gammaproteobacteria bacterium]|nr:hypothetical protein [Gammaproteobacteria bacterium]